MNIYALQILALFTFLFTSCNTTQINTNFVIIYADDLGYGDLGSYGNPSIRTPCLDKMATEGVRLTNFMIPANVCTPSRAALLTGCYPKRLSLHEHVLFPQSLKGINPDEELLPELLKDKGYITGCFGKWHLGHQEMFLPVQNGFDEYLGIPFSNDMSHTEQAKYGRVNYKYDLPLLSGNDTIELNPDQSRFTGLLTEKAVDFINRHHKSPFFLYVAHPMPHIPIYASGDFAGQSTGGLYGDVIEEIDNSVGTIIKALKKNGIDKNTMVIFSSDNGPWLSYKTHGGSAGPLRGGKQSTWEGGHRVPCIIRWPDNIKPASVITRQVTNMDILPTIISIASGNLPANKIDGKDITSLLMGNTDSEPYPFLYYSLRGPLSGIRHGNYKYVKIDDVEYLFDIDIDYREKFNLIDEMPEKAEELKKMMVKLDSVIVIEQRDAGWVDEK